MGAGSCGGGGEGSAEGVVGVAGGGELARVMCLCVRSAVRACVAVLGRLVCGRDLGEGGGAGIGGCDFWRGAWWGSGQRGW